VTPGAQGSKSETCLMSAIDAVDGSSTGT